MNCCNENKSKQEYNHKGHLSHMLMMALCCGAPVVLLLLLPLIGSALPGAKGTLSRVIPFLCPLLMIGMIPMMLRKNKSGGSRDSHNHNEMNNKEKLIIQQGNRNDD